MPSLIFSVTAKTLHVPENVTVESTSSEGRGASGFWHPRAVCA
jgi:hypothetical protein